MKFIAVPIALLVSLFPAFVAAASPYDDALKAAIKALSVSPSEHDVYKNDVGIYTRRDSQVNFTVSESAHCELTIHRDAKVVFSGARGVTSPESPDPDKFYVLPLSAMAKNVERKNVKSDVQAISAGIIAGGNAMSSKTYLNSDDTIVPLAALDAADAKPIQVASTSPLRAPAYGDEKSANAAIAALAALAAACH